MQVEKRDGRSARHLNTQGWRTCAELSKEKLNVLRSSTIITNLTGLPTRVSTARLGKALNGLCDSEAPRRKEESMCLDWS